MAWSKRDAGYQGVDRRVANVRRRDGYYAIRPEKMMKSRFFPELVIASRWIPMEWQLGTFASVELAENEAYANYPWIRPVQASAE